MDQMIKYNFSAIDASSADIQSSAARLNGQLDDLKQMLAPMVSTWEGESADAYNQAQAKWDQAALELNELLDGIGATVSEGNDAMSQVNRAAAASWG